MGDVLDLPDRHRLGLHDRHVAVAAAGRGLPRGAGDPQVPAAGPPAARGVHHRRRLRPDRSAGHRRAGPGRAPRRRDRSGPRPDRSRQRRRAVRRRPRHRGGRRAARGAGHRRPRERALRGGAGPDRRRRDEPVGGAGHHPAAARPAGDRAVPRPAHGGPHAGLRGGCRHQRRGPLRRLPHARAAAPRDVPPRHLADGRRRRAAARAAGGPGAGAVGRRVLGAPRGGGDGRPAGRRDDRRHRRPPRGASGRLGRGGLHRGLGRGHAQHRPRRAGAPARPQPVRGRAAVHRRASLARRGPRRGLGLPADRSDRHRGPRPRGDAHAVGLRRARVRARRGLVGGRARASRRPLWTFRP